MMEIWINLQFLFTRGLFCRKAQDEISDEGRAFTLYIKPKENINRSIDGDNNEVVDREKDMIGGENDELLKVFYAIIVEIL